MAENFHQPFDKDGKLGQSGKSETSLLKQLNNINFYDQPYPKSLGKEWLDKFFIPVLTQSSISVVDQISTLYEHISDQVTNVITNHPSKKVLVTGGGACNKYLIDRIKAKSEAQIFIPSKEIIEFKEAIIFALLGILRYKRQINCLSSVTGAKIDTSSGVIHLAT